jgi:hypothetical protein
MISSKKTDVQHAARADTGWALYLAAAPVGSQSYLRTSLKYSASLGPIVVHYLKSNQNQRGIKSSRNYGNRRNLIYTTQSFL